jgi:hypothetical protein
MTARKQVFRNIFFGSNALRLWGLYPKFRNINCLAARSPGRAFRDAADVLYMPKNAVLIFFAFEVSI